MADYAISNVPRRVVYANTGVGPYAFTFEILDQTDIAVYRGSTLLTITTDYSVTINTNGTGSVTLVTAGTGNITIVGAKNIQRTTDFTTGGDLFANSLNDELDNLTIFVQQVAETAERGMKAPVVDPTDINMTLPSKTDRAGTFLAFDSPSGNPIAGPSIASVGTVTQNIANINTVAADIANVNTVATNITNVNTVAGISGNVTTVAGISANVTSVAGNSSNINTVAGSISNVNATGSNIASVNAVAGELGAGQDVTVVAADLTGADNIGTVAGSIADINALGPIAADIATVAGIETDVTTVAGIDSDVTTVSGIAANVTTVAGISANVTSVAGNATNINTVATNITNVNAVGSNIANVNSVAGNATNINAVVSNATNINTVAGISSNVTTVATNNANVTTVATNITNVNTNATNIANINQNAANIVAIQNASANATAAANSATAAASSATSASASAAAASAVALGNEPVRHSVRPSLLLDFANTKTLDPRITFTRGSTGTFYDGKTVAKAEENLLQNSEDFSAWWSVISTAVTSNTTAAPNGTTTADSLNSTATSAACSIAPPIAGYIGFNGQPITISVYAKANTSNFLQIYSAAGIAVAHANFDISSGTAGNVGGTGVTSAITSVGNGWYRCSMSISSAGGSGAYFFALIDSGTAARAASYTGTIGTGIFLWGAQTEIRSSVTAYTATTTAPITNYIPALQTAASGVARFEHNPVTGESLGLEIEEQRTNLILQSEDFSTTWTATGATVSTNTIVSPNGTLTGDAVVESATLNNHFVTQSVSKAASAITYNATIYAKTLNGRGIRLALGTANRANGANIDVDLTTGVATTASVFGTGWTSPSGSVSFVGNGWYRISLTVTSNTDATINMFAYTYNGTTQFYTGDGFSGIYIWGAQLEAGAFATSYIPTTSATVTRSADSASMTGTNFSSWYRADEGTMYVEAKDVNVSTGFSNLVRIGDGTDNNRIVIFKNNSLTSVALGVAVANTAQAFLVNTSASFVTGTKVVGAYKTNDFASSSSGNTAVTDTLGTLPVVNQLVFGKNFSNTESLNGTIQKFAYYPRKLANAELVGLSTI